MCFYFVFLFFSTEGLDVSQVPLRPRGRPCRLLSDLVTMVNTDHGSNHSDNSAHDISPNQLLAHHDQVSPNQLLLQHSHDTLTQDIINLQQQVINRNNNDSEENGKYEHNGSGPLAEMEERRGEPEKTVELADVSQQDDESLSMSVELAAVNQAILSLTGTQPINISKPDENILSIIRTEPVSITKPDDTANKQMIVKQELPTTMVAREQPMQET